MEDFTRNIQRKKEKELAAAAIRRRRVATVRSRW